MDDNPLVSVADGRMISNGNFHPMVLALSFDALRPALVHVGQISERRMSHLWGAIFEGADVLLPEALSHLAQSSAGPLLRYAAATRYTQLRALAEPASLDVPPLDLGVEDHATNAPETVARTDRALDALEDLLAVELLMARTVLDAQGRATSLGAAGRAALRQITSITDEIHGVPPHDLEAAVRDGLRTRVLPAVRLTLSSARSSA
jgi:histidine ammonia-lyase